jgi:rhodanese-related sulfurtransferase
MRQRTILVVGGALAGPTAAARARELDEGARIVIIERNKRVSYALCGLAYHLSGEVALIDDLDQLQLIWNQADGRVVGMEAAGERGIDKRVDAATAAIAGGMTVEQLAALDFGYEPPYNAARDPLNVAATVASLERAGLGRSVESDEFMQRLGDVQVIDVRSGTEKGVGVPGSVAIPLEGLRGRLDDLDRKRPVVTVSQSGRRSWLAARILMQNGFTDVSSLSGGLLAWSLAQGESR